MKIFKFGGASVRNANAVQNLKKVLTFYPNEPLLIVVSAMGKMTNHLEKILAKCFENKTKEIEVLNQEFQKYHLEIIEKLDLKNEEKMAIKAKLKPFFQKLEILTNQNISENYNFNYDQIVGFGELISTTIVSSYLNYKKLKNQWIDARNYIFTDDNYRDAKVKWQKTKNNIEGLKTQIQTDSILIAQGFIAGIEDQKYTTTLGREGSDFSASIFAYCLDAEQVTIWKDVAGVLTADPKIYPNAKKIEELDYQEAIELTFYGASVIHPKTVKPLQEKQIPLWVKSFIEPKSQGTLIHQQKQKKALETCIILKKKQVLITFQTKDFSFVQEDSLGIIFSTLHNLSIKTNLTQNEASFFSICIDEDPIKLQAFIHKIKKHFVLKTQNNLNLLTLRHYDETAIEKHLENKKIIIEQRTKTTAQFVF